MITRLIQWTAVGIGVGILTGSASALFLYLLDVVTAYRFEHKHLVFLLPLVGYAVAWIYYRFASRADLGNTLLLQEFHESKSKIPFRMTPLVLFGSVLTHLCGGSAGREGSAIQMGGSLADQFTRFFKFDHRARQILLLTGFSSGFASVFGTPLAGTIFGFEFVVLGAYFRIDALYPALLAAIVGNEVTHAWGIFEHARFPTIALPHLTLQVAFWVIVSGGVFGLMARLFASAVNWVHRTAAYQFPYIPVRPLAGGIAFILFFSWIPMQRYWGLGTEIMDAAFYEYLPWYDSLGKTFATALTIGSGFKGGEVTPLFFIGATTGNTLSQILPMPLTTLTALGYVAVFAGAANAPLACTVMAMELFGAGIGPLAGLACIVSFLFSGNLSIYQGQKRAYIKEELSVRASWSTFSTPDSRQPPLP